MSVLFLPPFTIVTHDITGTKRLILPAQLVLSVHVSLLYLQSFLWEKDTFLVIRKMIHGRFTAALQLLFFLFFGGGGEFFALMGKTLFMVSFTHLRDSTRSSGEDARLRPVKESDTIFHHSAGNGMCFGFQF